MKSSSLKKFKSLRDKNGTHRRSKSSEPGNHKNRPLSTDVLFSYFKSDAAKQAAKEEQEKERLDANVEIIASRCDELRFHNINKDHIRFALLSKYSEGDVDKAIELIQLQQQAFSGTLVPYNPNVEMVGAENREFVTCYLDALLFAMYAKLEAFDCMLKNEELNENQRNLAALLRLWVNMLRTGKLIRTDMTETIQNALASCGWQDASILEQQDTSEAFAFITETLQLPLLTLQVDLFHQGERDADDHKVVYERLLNLAVPPDPENKGVQLEDCLEDYFNTRVDVLRDRAEDKKGAEKAALGPSETILLVPQESPADTSADAPAKANGPVGTVETVEAVGVVEANDEAGTANGNPGSEGSKSTHGSFSTADTTTTDVITATTTAETTENATAAAAKLETSGLALAPSGAVTASPIAMSPKGDPTNEAFDRDPAPVVRRWTMAEPHTDTSETPAESSSAAGRRPSALSGPRQRSASIIQRIVIEDGKPSEPQEASTLLQQFKKQGSTIMKAVTIPAWQFFRLIPWHSTSNSEPQSDVEVMRQFNKRPVVGICLKRYLMNEHGQFLRHNTYIDIPDSLRLPYFMMGEDGQQPDGNALSNGYKLVLQSVVCHRGVSLHSGHYISFARVNPKLLTDNRCHDFDPPPDYEEQQWVKFDDLDVERRVSAVDDIKAALKEEMPYLLFYQIVPIMDVNSSTTTINETNEPPSYDASTTNAAVTPLVADRLDANGSSYFDSATLGGSTTTGPSIRFSSEMDRPPRFSLDDESVGSSSLIANSQRRAAESASRRGSLGFTSSLGGTPVITPEGGRSPVINPSDEPSTAQRLSRAAARLTGKTNRSRPPSQAGEGRMSLTMSRLGGLVRSSKEPLRLSEDGIDASTATIPLTPNALGSNTTLTTVHTAPAASATAVSPNTIAGQPLETVPSADSGLPDGQDDAGRHHHHLHHHHHHHSHFRRKDKESQAPADGSAPDLVDNATAADGNSNGNSGSGKKDKGKDKEKAKTKGLPERECSVM
ncbi:hypothetical protein SPBR_06476 [Sporothrix brasiliensis 5110]|uniref:ubiquitinyl hydrolase 1 n=1 Tax=Sporothrix brasiliensis 5110 TaxID=1398154 RepID=A0A0C2IM60_9PEZI|nr:uncharacterized protein SPBR_06476 [Sporothrix brasiliensis 5110]KIH88080.1 hypothetical protein SPBR_06476 [Sporothrix brasiliensis 5110]